MAEGKRLLERILDGVEEPRDLPFELLKEITKDFSKERKIGQGGFGEVYKGILGERIVAVKRIHINENTIDDKLFRREVTSLMKMYHRNIVQFLGVCSGGYHKPIEKSGEYIWANVLERLLCFKYISNGGLDRHITDELRGLDWETRYEIITGICKGLRYLHEEKNILHMDLKPANILLDLQDGKYMVPKITDFGLSRSNEKSHTVGQRYGTLEYMAPEYRDHSKTTQSCDIYSLGLIIIELVTGCKDVPNNDNILRRWRHRWREPPTQRQYQQVTRCIDVAGRCRAKTPENRPTISWIINFLNESESTTWKMSPSLDEDDMLRIDPLELRPKNEISWSVELTNDTRNCTFAFNIQLPSTQYSVQPYKGIVRPKSKYSVKITVQARVAAQHNRVDKFIVQSMQVEANEGLRDEDISEGMFKKTGKVVDEVDLIVVHETTEPQENLKRNEDTNTPAEEVPEPKNCASSSVSSGKLAEMGKIASAGVDAGSVLQEAIESGQVHHGDQGIVMVTRDISCRHYTRLISNQINQEVVTGAISTLLPILGDLLTEEYDLQKKTRDEIKSLKAKLESMDAALIKVSETPLDQQPDIQVKVWARDVRDLSYEIEDSIDEFLACLECRKQKKPHNFMGFITRSIDMLNEGKIHKIGVDIKDNSTSINEIKEMPDRYKDDSAASKRAGTNTDTLNQSAFSQKASELIGTKEKSLDIARMLTGDSGKQLKMVSIFGFGGLGKTTLAKLVYENLRGEFDYAAFLSVSLNPNMGKLYESFLYQFDGQDNNIMYESKFSDIQLISKIRDFLQTKRYLIVIDDIDIWDKSMWNNARSALVENQCGSRVIATTRILDVAKEIGVVYQLQPLSTSDSRRLFNQNIFGSEDKCPPTQLAEVSENILRKCAGVPLPIITLASMLSGKKGHEDTYTYWSKVYQSMGSGLENNPDIKDMRRILYVSYYALPPNLKACLLYLSLYPKDCSIKTKRLIWKWIGEGFVHEEQGKSLYEVGEAYFDELINRSLIQPMDINIANKVSTCCVHDMVFGLISSLSSDENFLTTLGGQHPRLVPSKVRRLSLQISEEDAKQIPTMRFSSARSLTVFSTSLNLSSALSGFPVLQTLDLSGCVQVGNHHMKDICNLFKLRFLCLKGTSIDDIPKEIGNLQLLQVLDIRSYRSLKKLPSSFVQLRQLVFVDMGDCLISTFLIRSMSSFASLSSLTIGLKELREEDLQVLGSMPSLYYLSIVVARPRRGAKKMLLIDNGSPFRCLTRLSIEAEAIDFVFTQGTLQMLQILWLDIGIGDFRFGLENLTSLEHVYVEAHGHGDARKEAMENALRKVLDLNPNKPRLTAKFHEPRSKTNPTEDIRRSQMWRLTELSIEE